jgi:uncharacterized membrane protein YhaH (DUF805 family)
MHALSLLFDPRGAIDRSTFWSGLAQLALVSLAICLGLGRLDQIAYLAALPVVGDAYAIGILAGWLYGGNAPDIAVTTTLLLVAARYYVAVCLMLKRSRHAGRGARPVVAFGLISAMLHGLMGLWAWDLYGDDMAMMIPMAGDLAATTLIWMIFVAWLGSTGRRHPVALTPGLQARIRSA